MEKHFKAGSNIRYIDLDESELMHWKYIKKEKLPNGKVRYYYDQSELDKYENTIKTARGHSINAAANVYQLQKEYDAAVEARKDAWWDNNTRHTLGKSGVDTFKAYAKAQDDVEKARKALNDAKKSHEYHNNLVDRVIKEYEVKKITSFPARVISKGIVAVANWLGKYF